MHAFPLPHRRRPLPPRAVLFGLPIVGAGILGMALALPTSLQADGGTLRIANVPMGTYRVNVFTDPTPIPPDTLDVSVLVTFERGRGVALGLDIQVVASRVDGQGPTHRLAATREQAEDPRFYSAKFALGSVGEWDIRVLVEGPEGQGEVSFRVEAQEPGFLGNPFIILILAVLPLLLVGWWLKGSGAPTPASA